MEYNGVFVVICFVRQRAPLRCKTANVESRRLYATVRRQGPQQLDPRSHHVGAGRRGDLDPLSGSAHEVAARNISRWSAGLRAPKSTRACDIGSSLSRGTTDASWSDLRFRKE